LSLPWSAPADPRRGPQPRRDASRQQPGHPAFAFHPTGDRARVRAVAPIDIATHGAANGPAGILHHEEPLEETIRLRHVGIGGDRVEPDRYSERGHGE